MFVTFEVSKPLKSTFFKDVQLKKKDIRELSAPTDFVELPTKLTSVNLDAVVDLLALNNPDATFTLVYLVPSIVTVG